MIILQINANRSRAAHDLAFAAATREGADLLVITEPNKNLIKGQGWLKDKRSDVAILFRNNKIEVAKVEEHQGYIKVQLKAFDLYGIYLSPNIVIDQYEEQLGALMEDVRSSGNAVVVGDFNAKAPEWGAPRMLGGRYSLSGYRAWTWWFIARGLQRL